MRRPTPRYQYVRREPTVADYLAMLVPAGLVALLGYLGLLFLVALAGPGTAAIVWVCGLLLLSGIAHAQPPLTMLRWGWVVAGAVVVLTA